MSVLLSGGNSNLSNLRNDFNHTKRRPEEQRKVELTNKNKVVFSTCSSQSDKKHIAFAYMFPFHSHNFQAELACLIQN